jgi:hypothetical protein
MAESYEYLLFSSPQGKAMAAKSLHIVVRKEEGAAPQKSSGKREV